MIITIHQPEHLPWLGFFNKLSKAEVFVVLDNVQFEKNYFQNRNKVLGSSGAQWLGIPVQSKGHMDGDIASIQIADATQPKWRQKYLQTIKMSYGKYPYFDEVYSILEGIISSNTTYLYDINFAIIKAFSEKLGFFPKFVRATELDVQGLKSNLILDICKALNATTYIAGPSGRDYLDKASFDEANIEVVFNDYHHPVYEQRRTEEFVPYLSALDLFMNVGFEAAREVILKGNESFGSW